MDFNECDAKAKELLEVLGMWGFSKKDCVIIAERIAYHAKRVRGDTIPNKLAGTGLKPISAIEKDEARQRIFHEPKEREIN